MALYRVGFRTAAGAGAALFDLRTSTVDRVYVREIALFAVAATASSLQIIRPTAIGAASVTTAGQPVDPADPASAITIGTGWSTQPTLGPIPLARFTLPAVIGAGIVLSYAPRDLIVPVSNSLVVSNVGGVAAPAYDGWIVWEE